MPWFWESRVIIHRGNWSARMQWAHIGLLHIQVCPLLLDSTHLFSARLLWPQWQGVPTYWFSNLLYEFGWGWNSQWMMVFTPLTQKADAQWVLICHHTVVSKDLVPTEKWHVEWREIWLLWRTISCHSGQQSLCCPLSQTLCFRVMRCEGDSVDKVSPHRFVNFNVASVEPYIRGDGIYQTSLWKQLNRAAVCVEEVRIESKLLGGFEMVLDGFSRNYRFLSIVSTYIPQILITWQVQTYDISLQKPLCFTKLLIIKLKNVNLLPFTGGPGEKSYLWIKIYQD